MPGRFHSMKSKHITLYGTALLFASFSLAAPSHALGLGQLQQPGGIIQQRVEDRTDRLIERAAERRREMPIAEPVIETSVPLPQLTPELPDRILVMATDGSQAFVDVRVEDGWRAVEKQWLVVLEPSELNLLDQPGIQIIDQVPLAALGLNVVRFSVTETLDSPAAMARMLPASIFARLDRNHIYSPQTGQSQGTNRPSRPYVCNKPLVVGMVDTAIQTEHPSFSNATIVQKRFLADIAEPTGHGTAVASVLVGRLPGRSEVRMPQTTLVNASVFFSRQDLTSGATLMHLVEGLNWLISQEVSIVNISMAGPDNRLLAVVTQRMIEAGIPLVAAVGNQGPAAPPLYPAAYPHVIAVTAVDEFNRIYRWANQGTHVDFAARGVGVVLANGEGKFSSQSGTSIATPVITAYLACSMGSSPASSSNLTESLARDTVDLGEAGPDSVFGHGLVGE